MNESQLLLITAASVGFLHTILGPDHYLPFTMMGRARGWSLSRTLRITLLCGVGHVGSSVALGAVGLLLGTQLAALTEIEGLRGSLAGWALLTVGLVYLAWGLRAAGRGQEHSHLHAHPDVVHDHVHDHHEDHSHPHDQQQPGSLTPWALFIVFVLGPCEALIPLLMYPAARQSTGLTLWVALVFSAATLATMAAAVVATTRGLERLKLPGLQRWEHALAGGAIAACGAAITFLGL
jgi:sulfite exporter TauE/SafE